MPPTGHDWPLFFGRFIDVTKSKSHTAVTNWLLAVDAGGTKTTAWLVEADDSENTRVVGRGRSSGGNPLSVGFVEATQAIWDALAQTRAEADLPSAPIARAILSIAGAADADMRSKIVQWAHETGLSQRVAIVSDFLPVLAAGTPDCIGVAVISGTGSSAFARSSAGRTARSGGWGYLLGDEGSGFAIGRAALQLALGGLEVGSEPESLARTVLRALGVNSVSELTNSVYKCSDARAKIAAIAAIVIAAADNGDSAAQSILESAARDLAAIVGRAVRLVGLTENPIAVAASGGVLLSSKTSRDSLQVELRNLGLNCELRVVDEPLEGCVRLAASEFAGTLVEWQ
jgi:N-acetylglucosamine kinase-like BadF-type ATPase